MKHKKKHHKARAVLRQPYHPSLLAHQRNVMLQHQFLAAEQAVQNRINTTQRISFTGNPYIR